MRPKIKIIPTRTDNILEQISSSVLLIMWMLVIYIFLKSPATIPIHFNATGEADSYGSKITILILPVVGTVIYFLLTVLTHYPHLFNYPVAITETNAERQYRSAVRLLRIVKLAVLVILTLLVLFIYLTAVGIIKGLGPWFLPFTVVSIMLPTIIMLGKALRKQQ